MKKTNNEKLLDYAMLAEASYGDFSGNQVNLYYDLQKENVEMTAIQSNYINKNYNFIAHWKDNDKKSGFSGTLFQNKSTGEYILSLKGTKGLTDLIVDAADLGFGQGLAYGQIVDLYNFTKLLTSKEKVYSGVKLNDSIIDNIKFRKSSLEVQLDRALTSGQSEAIEKEIQFIKEELARIEKMLNFSIDGYYIEKGFSSEEIYKEEIGKEWDSHKYNNLIEKLPDNVKFTVVGHSLGGHLAMAFSRMFPELTNHVYAFNGAGFGERPGHKVNTFFESILDRKSTFDEEKISSIIAYKNTEFVAMNEKWGLKQVGKEYFSFTHEDGLLASHFVKPLVDTMASISLISGLDKRFADLSLSEIFESEGNKIEINQTNAKSITKILESISYDDNKFFGLFVQKFYRQLTGYEVKINFEDKNDIYTVFFDLYKKFVENENPDFEKGSFKITAAHDITDFVAKALSPEGYAYRYALKHLNSFVIEHEKLYAEDGVLKDELPSLKLYNENDLSTEEGMTVEYIMNRTEMLISNIQLILSSENNERNKLYHDIEKEYYNLKYMKKYFDIKPLSDKIQLSSFGTDEKDNFLGINIPDIYDLIPSITSIKIFSGSQDDNIRGRKGNDYFEGGTGFDTYHIEGYDLIHDVDGKGKILKNNKEIASQNDVFKAITENIWQTEDKKQTAIRKDKNLEIIEDGDEKTKVTIFDFFNPKFDKGEYFVHLGIALEKQPENLLDYEFPTHDMQIGAPNKNNTFYGSGEYVWYRGGDKTDRVISSFKEGMIAELGNGSDLFLGNIKKDIAWGDGGKDVLIGSNRNEENIDDPDYIEGGEDKDLINGGSGNDVLYGDNPDLISYTKTNPAISYDFSDWIVGGFGDDKMFGSAGKDILVGGGHKDIIFGGAGSDLILGDAQLLFDYKHMIPAINSSNPVTNEFTFDSKAKTWFADKSKGFYHFKIKEESFDWSFNIKYDEEKTDYEIISEYKLKEDTPIDPKGDTDYLYGGEGDDLMLGQKGNDFMFGEDGDDIMFGDDNRDLSLSGHDYMSGGTGNNQLFGGKGNDNYIITANSKNTINDIEGTDAIDLSDYHSSAFQFNYSGGSLFVFSQLNNISVEIKNWLNNGIEKFHFKDGTLEPEDIQKLADQNNNQPLLYPIDPSLYHHPNDDFV